MKNYLLPFLSIIIGVLFVLWIKPIKKDKIKLLLAFSGSFLMGMTVFTLIPEVYYTIFEENHQTLSISISLLDVDTHIFGKKIGFWVIIGILLQIILEFFSHGAEHGHFHSPANKPQYSFYSRRFSSA